jgi:hypothetical protein
MYNRAEVEEAKRGWKGKEREVDLRGRRWEDEKEYRRKR